MTEQFLSNQAYDQLDQINQKHNGSEQVYHY